MDIKTEKGWPNPVRMSYHIPHAYYKDILTNLQSNYSL